MSIIFGFTGPDADRGFDGMRAQAIRRLHDTKVEFLPIKNGFISGDIPIDTPDGKCVIDGYFRLPGRQTNTLNGLASLITKNDIDRISKINGLYSFAFWDNEQETLYLFRDASGCRPLYYFNSDDRFIFASAPRIIFAGGIAEPSLHPGAVSYYLSMIGVPDPYTLFDRVQSLQPGHFLKWRNGQVQIFPYQVPHWISRNQSRVSETKSSSNLRAALENAVQDAVSDSENLGFFLSGGTDTTTIVGLAAQAGLHPIDTYTIGYSGSGEGYDAFNEFEHARFIAEKYGTRHHEFRISPQNVLQSLPGIIFGLDQPSGDAINSYLVAQTLPEDCRIVLTGTGGDELFIGSHWYLHQQNLINRYKTWSSIPSVFRKGILSLSGLIPSIGRKFRAMDQLQSGVLSQYKQIKFIFDPFEKEQLFTPQYLQLVSKYPSCDDIVRDYDSPQADADDINRMAALFLKHEVINVQLRDLDAMCWAHGMEARSPLMDFRVQDILAGVPGTLKFSGNQLRYLMYKALPDIIPMETRTRKKMSFIVPMEIWAHRELKPLIDKVLSRDVIEKRGIFNPAYVQQVYDNYYHSHSERHPFKVWNLVVFELWCRIHLDNFRQTSPPEKIEDVL